MAGSISLSGSQQFDQDGVPLSGGLFYTFAAGTTTPQSCFQDIALTIAYPNPITLLADGRIPFFNLADGNIKIRLTDKNGVTVIAADNILVVGPSSGGGGGGGVDPTTVFQTGDLKNRYVNSTHTGWVRCNGRTVGSASSGAAERANADVQALFEFLWGADPNLTVSTGRGASANADWLANKTITLPDFRGRVLAALDDMGNSAAGRVTSGGSGITGTTLGAAGGAQAVTLNATMIPPIPVTIPANQGSHGHPGSTAPFAISNQTQAGSDSAKASSGSTGITIAANTLPAMTGTGNNGVTAAAVNKMPPAAIVSIFIKL